MTVLITGATGFLGARVVRRYLAQGQDVVAVGRDAEKLADLARGGARVLSWDLADPPPATDRLDGVETVIHCAALSAPFGPKNAFMRANVDGTRNLVALAETLGVARFVHISTPAVYYRPRDQFEVREDAPLPPPVNHYADTKRRAEEIVLSRFPSRAVVLRPRGLYGPGDTALLPRLLRAVRSGPLPLMRGGAAVTDLTHVEDVVDGILAAEARGSGIINISGGEPIAVKGLIDTLCRHHGLIPQWRNTPVPLAMAAARVMEMVSRVRGGGAEPRTTPYSLGLLAYSQTLDIRKAKADLGWEPRTPFSAGLAEVLAASPAGPQDERFRFS